MTPQIVAMDVGRHNADLGASSARILEGHSWKRQRIIMLIPAGRMVPSKAALSWMNLIFPPNQAVIRWLCMNMEVGQAYSTAIEQIMSHPELSTWEYLLTVEHDNVPPSDGVLKLIKRLEDNQHLACVGGLYWTKGEQGVPQIWGDVNDPVVNFRPQPPRAGELVECCGTGMGFNLWRLGMFKDERLRKPWFATQAGPSGVGTQDLYAWSDFRKHGYRCAVDCDCLVGHFDSENDIVW